MRSPAAAIAWEFRRRHRWGLVAVLAYLAALAAVRIFVGGAPSISTTTRRSRSSWSSR